MLDGGLPHWLKAGYEVEATTPENVTLRATAVSKAIKSIYHGQHVSCIFHLHANFIFADIFCPIFILKIQTIEDVWLTSTSSCSFCTLGLWIVKCLLDKGSENLEIIFCHVGLFPNTPTKIITNYK